VQTGHVSTLEHRVEEFLHAPLAAAFFVLADRDDLGPEHLADPSTASTLAATAVSELDPWTGDAEALRIAAVDAVTSLRPLVHQVLADERNDWWQSPLQRRSQLLLRGCEDRQPDPTTVPVPSGALSRWETYAQKPAAALTTSTELHVPVGEPVRSGAHATLALGGGDWNAVYPVRQDLLHVAPEARVAEVHSATDWHDLVARYSDRGTHPGSDSNLDTVAGIDNGLAPTWSAVAADYDGVHLSFAGLLSALYVPMTTADIGTTTLWAWGWECSYWIRSVFTSISELPPLLEPPQAVDHWAPLL
jgi:hypothetical protein